MAEDVFDKLPMWTNDAFDRFRNEKYPFLYLCGGCTRSFDSKEPADKCKFCGHGVTEIRSMKRGKGFMATAKPTLYRYFCPTCEKNFTTSEKLAVCSRCRTDYLHVYTWDTLRKRDRFRINLNKSVKALFQKQERGVKSGTTMLKIPRLRASSKEELPSY